eukprot:1188748-Prorocentrum_minimum.AAC.3
MGTVKMSNERGIWTRIVASPVRLAGLSSRRRAAARRPSAIPPCITRGGTPVHEESVEKNSRPYLSKDSTDADRDEVRRNCADKTQEQPPIVEGVPPGGWTWGQGDEPQFSRLTTSPQPSQEGDVWRAEDVWGIAAPGVAAAMSTTGRVAMARASEKR